MVGLQLTPGRISETQLNAQNSQTVTGDQSDPVAFVFSDGGAGVFYESPFPPNPPDIDLHGTFFSSSTGLPTGAEIGPPAIGFSGSVDLHPAAALLSNGGDASIPVNRGLVVWESGPTNNRSILGQLVDSNGQALTASPFVVADPAGNQVLPDVAGLSTGRAVVVYEDDNTGFINAEVLNTDGQTVAVPPFAIGAAGGTAPVVTGLANGQFVVAWVGTDVDGSGVHAQIFDQNGTKIGNELGTPTSPLNVITQGDQDQVAITTLSNGNFAVAWTDDSTRAGAPGQTVDASGTAIKARVFSAAGVPVSDEVTVNTATNGNQNQPSITAGPNGGFVVGWTDASQQADSNGAVDAQGTAIKAQAFDAGGAKIGGELLVNSITTGNQDSVDLSTAANGTILAVFRDSSGAVIPGSSQTADGSGFGIQSASLTVSTTTTTGDTTPPILAFNPTVTFKKPNIVTLSGTYDDPSGVTGVEIFEGATDLGAATLNNGTFTFTHAFSVGFHNGISAVATDGAGNQNSPPVPNDFDVTIGTRRDQAKLSIDNYDSTGLYLGTTSYNAKGGIYLKFDYSVLPNGFNVYNFTGGTSIAALGLDSYKTTYNNRGNLFSNVLNVASNGRADEISADGSFDTFVFKRGYGEDTITTFNPSNPHHDTLSLAKSEFATFADVLRNASQEGGDTLITGRNGDSITLLNVAVDSLTRQDFKFHA